MAGIEKIFGLKNHMNNHIFISIPTMNDYQYLNTIEKIFDEAEKPDNIFIGTTVFWKKEDIPDNKKPFFYSFYEKIKKNYKNVNIDILPWEKYPGVGFGRIEPIKHFNNEKYYLSLDSHSHCVKNWDTNLIDIYENSKKVFGSRRLITTYLADFFPDGERLINDSPDMYSKTFLNTNISEKHNAAFLKESQFSRWQYFDYYGHIALNKELLTKKYIFPLPNDINPYSDNAIMNHIIDNNYLPAKKISAHFMFTEADPWVTQYNICLDPRIQFWAEEFYQSSLSYARGYNFIWIKTPIFFHQYGDGSKNGFTRKININNLDNYYNNDEEKEIYLKFILKNEMNDINYFTQTNYENKLIEFLLNKKVFFGYLPRSINSFLKYANIDLYNQKCSPWWEVPEINVIYK